MKGSGFVADGVVLAVGLLAGRTSVKSIAEWLGTENREPGDV